MFSYSISQLFIYASFQKSYVFPYKFRTQQFLISIYLLLIKIHQVLNLFLKPTKYVTFLFDSTSQTTNEHLLKQCNIYNFLKITLK